MHVAWPSCACLLLSFFPFPVGHSAAPHSSHLSPVDMLSIRLGLLALQALQPLPAERHHLEKGGQQDNGEDGQEEAEQQLQRHLSLRLVHFRLSLLIGLIVVALPGAEVGFGHNTAIFTMYLTPNLQCTD